MTRNLALTLLIGFLAVSCSSPSQNRSETVVTTSWCAAIAETAGAQNIHILAPFEMEHPSEYELRPGDIAKLSNASLIIYGGYETVVGKIESGLNIPSQRLLEINTSYNYAELQESVIQIAKKLNTVSIAEKNLENIKHLYLSGKESVANSDMEELPAVVHYFQQEIAKELGLKIVGVFGPGPLEAQQIAKLAQTNARLIIDNRHNPIGKPIQQVLSDAKYCLFINFPGTGQTRSIEDVIRYNLSQLTE